MLKLDIQQFGGRGANSSNGYNNILSIEKNRIGMKSEKLTILSKNGKVLQELDGGENYVDAGEYRDLMKNAIITHNHPTDDNFSSGDIKEFIDSDIYEIRASTSKEVYSLKKGTGKLNKNIKDDYKKEDMNAWNYANKKLEEKIKNKTLGYKPSEQPARFNVDRQRLKAEYKHEWFKKNARKYGYIYERKSF